jgi:hypothetical protein
MYYNIIYILYKNKQCGLQSKYELHTKYGILFIQLPIWLNCIKIY